MRMPSGVITAARSVRRSFASIPVRADAAALSVSRAMAPASRSLSKLSGTVVEPPVSCIPMILSTPPMPPRIASTSNRLSFEAKGTDSSASARL